MAEDEPVTIVDREVLRVLSADTRMDILKILSSGGRTPSFVAKKLKKSDATIVEHLQTLENAGLVKKTVSPRKKWVFYSLTERGHGIVSSKSRRLVIILATSLIGMVLGVGSFASYMYTAGTFAAQRAPESLAAPVIGGAETAAESAGAIAMQHAILLYASIILLAISFSGLGFYFYRKSRFEELIK